MSGWWLVAIRSWRPARPQARRVTRRHRAQPRPDQGRGRGGQAQGRRRHRSAGGQGHQPVQGRQALRTEHRRGELQLRSASATASPPRRRSTASTSTAPRWGRRRMDAADCVRNYKALANVERAFRSLKTIDLKVRPIHHRTADRVRAHIFVCLLAYYVEWHMREAWRELMFADPSNRPRPRATRWRRPSARRRARQGSLPHLGRWHAAHSFATLLPSCHHRAQHLPHAQRREPTRRPSICSPRPTPSNSAPRTDPEDPGVDRNRNRNLKPST